MTQYVIFSLLSSNQPVAGHNTRPPADEIIKKQVLSDFERIDPHGWLLHRDNHTYRGSRGALVYLTKLLRYEAQFKKLTSAWLNKPWLTFHGMCSSEFTAAFVKSFYKRRLDSFESWPVDITKLAELSESIAQFDFTNDDLRTKFEANPDFGMITCSKI